MPKPNKNQQQEPQVLEIDLSELISRLDEQNAAVAEIRDYYQLQLDKEKALSESAEPNTEELILKELQTLNKASSDISNRVSNFNLSIDKVYQSISEQNEQIKTLIDVSKESSAIQKTQSDVILSYCLVGIPICVFFWWFGRFMRRIIF